MAYKHFVIALGVIVAASPITAAQPERPAEAGAPAASPDAKYCLRVEAVTGSRIENILCETRDAWAELGVDVDKDWAKEGVRVVQSG